MSITAPTGIAGCNLWLRAGVGLFDAVSGGAAVADGGAVARWESQVAGIGHAIQASAANRPRRNGALVSTELSQFVAAAQYLNLPSFSLDRQAFSLFFIVGPAVSNQLGTAYPNSFIQVFAGSAVSNVYYDANGQQFIYNDGTNSRTSSFARPSPTSRLLLGVIYGPSGFTFVLNDQAVTLAALPSGSTTGGLSLFSNFNATDFSEPVDAAHVFAFNRAVNLTSELADIRAYAQAEGAVFPPAATANWQVAGDSRAAGSSGTRNRSWFSLIGLPATALLNNDSQAGTTQQTINSTIVRQTSRYLGGVPNTAIVAGGTNDLAIGSTVANLQSYTQAACNSVRNTGTRTLAVTLLPRSDFDATKEAARVAYNAWLRGLFASDGTKPAWADGLLDFAADPTLGPTSATANATYYPDGVHHSDAAAAMLANYARPFAAATGYALTIAGSGTAATATLTAAAGSTFTGNQKIRLAWGDGTYATVTPVAGATTASTGKTYAVPGTYSVAGTNSQGWTDPTAATYATALFPAAADVRQGVAYGPTGTEYFGTATTGATKVLILNV